MKRTKSRDRVRRNSTHQADNVIRLDSKAVDPEQSIERDIVAALITSTEYIKRVKSFMRPDLLPEKWTRQVAQWCIDYFDKYKHSPGQDIESWFEDRREQFGPDEREGLRTFLQNLRRDYDGSSIDVDYVVDRTKAYLRRRHSEAHDKKIAGLTERDETQKAEELRQNYSPLSFGDGQKEVLALSEVGRKRVKWLLPHLLPCGYMTLLAGVKGRGKTLLALGWAAQLSRGDLGPHKSIGDSLIISTEDDAGDMIGPRVDVAGGDDRRIRVVQGVTAHDDDGQLVVDLWDTKNVAKLRQWLDAYPETKLVLIDPVSAHIPNAQGRSSENVQVRRALAPLAKLAAEREIAIILTTHTRKGHEGSAIEKIIDSTAYVALSRMVIVMGRNPDDPDNTRKGIAAVAESNLTAERLSFEYRLDSVEADPTVGEQPILVIGDVSPIKADELLSKPKKPEELILEGEIEDWILQQLKDGWVASTDLYTLGKQEEYSPNQVRGSLHRVHARKKLHGFGADGQWGWQLKADRGPKSLASLQSLQSLQDRDDRDDRDLRDYAYRVLRKGPISLTAITKEFRAAGHQVDKKQVREIVRKYGQRQKDGPVLYSLPKEE